MPRILKERVNIVVLGPEGAGKTSVACRLAGDDLLYLDTRQTQNALVDFVSKGEWAVPMLEMKALVLDGPIWLRNRPAAVSAFCGLMRRRRDAGRHTYVCQSDSDGSVEQLIAAMEPGSLVIIGLRFPKGARGRLRFARRMCDEMGLAPSLARGADQLDPWRYDGVVEYLKRQDQGSLKDSVKGPSPEEMEPPQSPPR